MTSPRDPLVDWGALVVPRARAGSPPRGPYRFAARSIACELRAAAAVSVREHALATPRREVGGLLVGEVYDREGRGFDVEVFAALPARGAVSGALQVTFGIAAWLELIQQRRQYPDARVVGWYHSHPGVGVFMSPTDRNLHEAFFSALPWYLALVVDPACDGFGVFARDDGVLVELARASTVPGSSEVAT